MPVKKPLGLYAGDFEGFTTGDFIDVQYGGTGAVTKQDAFNNLSPLNTKGDIVVSNGTNNVALGVGTNGQALVADSTLVSGLKWATLSGGGGTVIVKGTAIIDFGTAGSDEARVVVLEASVTANSVIYVAFNPSGTLDNDADEHLVEPTKPKISNIVPGVSFEIAMITEEAAPLLGKWSIDWLIT